VRLRHLKRLCHHHSHRFQRHQPPYPPQCSAPVSTSVVAPSACVLLCSLLHSPQYPHHTHSCRQRSARTHSACGYTTLAAGTTAILYSHHALLADRGHLRGQRCLLWCCACSYAPLRTCSEGISVGSILTVAAARAGYTLLAADTGAILRCCYILFAAGGQPWGAMCSDSHCSSACAPLSTCSEGYAVGSTVAGPEARAGYTLLADSCSMVAIVA
jgi:hypothetical protein